MINGVVRGTALSCMFYNQSPILRALGFFAHCYLVLSVRTQLSLFDNRGAYYHFDIQHS